MQHDFRDISTTDLAELFRRSVNISSTMSNSDRTPLQPETIDSPNSVPAEPVSINYSISQHYTHSAHIVQAMNTNETLPSDFFESPPKGLSIYQILDQHNIPPSCLLRSQLTLFEQADEDQRARLIQLWTISPPNRTRGGGQALTNRISEYQTRNLEQEEESVWPQQQGNVLKESCQSEVQLKYGHGEYGSWYGESGLEDAETYITSGYEQLAQRDYNAQGIRTGPTSISTSTGLIFGNRWNHATDPIYQSREWHHDHPGQQDQYSMLARNNHHQTPAEHVITIQEAEDEEML